MGSGRGRDGGSASRPELSSGPSPGRRTQALPSRCPQRPCRALAARRRRGHERRACARALRGAPGARARRSWAPRRPARWARSSSASSSSSALARAPRPRPRLGRRWPPAARAGEDRARRRSPHPASSVAIDAARAPASGRSWIPMARLRQLRVVGAQALLGDEEALALLVVPDLGAAGSPSAASLMLDVAGIITRAIATCGGSPTSKSTSLSPDQGSCQRNSTACRPGANVPRSLAAAVRSRRRPDRSSRPAR